ncbi:MAG TPA: NUDIX domain-containing protein [Clostridia bacterium]|nr:NUDIX domain-containing protein [Clostridia bacterium]
MTGYIKSLREIVGHRPLLQCGASVIIFGVEGKVLMLHRTDNDCWCFPGGSIEPGEKVEDAARREVYEETGLKVEALDLFDIFSGEELYYKYPNGDEVYNIDIVFMTSKYYGEANSNDESNGFKFFSIDDLPREISPPVKPVIQSLVERYASIKNI